ncbi:MAG: ferredoxin--NADP reductase [Bacteroidota bacterium]
MPEQDPITLRIKQIIPETTDTKSFVLEPVNGEKIKYTAGQFLTLLLRKRNGEEVRRNYSISSSPESNESLQITVKRIPNGEFSRQLIDHAKEGDELRTIGASGFFTLPGAATIPEQLFFFAAGSGIAPVYALIQTVLLQYTNTRLVLIYSNPSKFQTIFYKALRDLEDTYPGRFAIEFLFSDASDIHHKRLGIYLLEKLLNKYVKGAIAQPLFYLCGPFEYMRMVTIVLRNQGAPAAHIRKEMFVINTPVQKAEPPDTLAHTVMANLPGKEYQFTSQYPDTILQTAKRLQIPLPYSCESGQCGTCAATCVSGKVWMWRNDVLLDEEIAKGRVLTCTGYAVGGDVEIIY